VPASSNVATILFTDIESKPGCGSSTAIIASACPA
jgi:hypothetical protein